MTQETEEDEVQVNLAFDATPEEAAAIISGGQTMFRRPVGLIEIEDWRTSNPIHWPASDLMELWTIFNNQWTKGVEASVGATHEVLTFQSVDHEDGRHQGDIRCPFGIARHELLMREKWRICSWMEGEPIQIEYADGNTREEPSDIYWADEYGSEEWYTRMCIESGEDCEAAGWTVGDDDNYQPPEGQPKDSKAPTRWRSPESMPLWACRVSMAVESIKLERIQDIPYGGTRFPSQVVRSGCPEEFWADTIRNGVKNEMGKSELDWFRFTWDRDNPKPEQMWHGNPWVWVVEFLSEPRS